MKVSIYWTVVLGAAIYVALRGYEFKEYATQLQEKADYLALQVRLERYDEIVKAWTR